MPLGSPNLFLGELGGVTPSTKYETLTSFLSTAWSPSDYHPADQLFYLTNFSLSFSHDLFIAIILLCGAPSPCHIYVGFLQLQAFMHLTAQLALKPVGWEQKELIARGAVVIPKIPAGKGPDAPILVLW